MGPHLTTVGEVFYMGMAIIEIENWMYRREPLDMRKMTILQDTAANNIKLVLSDIVEGIEYKIEEVYQRGYLTRDSNYYHTQRLMMLRLDQHIRKSQEELRLNLTP